MQTNTLRASISDPALVASFVFAGDAYFTLVRICDGKRFTYRVKRADGENDDRPWFVSLLSGPDNDCDYRYLGAVFPDSRDTIRFTSKTTVRSESSPLASRLIAWFFPHLAAGAAGKAHNLAQIEFWHEGRCGRCGRRLTVPSSIESGIGPTCASRG